MVIRRMVFSAVAASVLLAGGAGWAAASHRPLFDAKTRLLGIQTYMLGPEFSSSRDQFFGALAQAGYRRLESDLEVAAQPAYRTLAARNGLTVASVHINPAAILPEAGEKLPALVEKVRATGARYAGISVFPFDFRKLQGNHEPMTTAIAHIAGTMTADDWQKVAQMMNVAGARFDKAGITLFYHNHNVEFRPLEGTTPFAILMKNTDPKLVSFELDAGWAAAAGLDPVQLLRSYPGRFRLMHVKDLTAETMPNYEFGIDSTEIGSGRLDWPRIIGAARAAGINEFFVEQEPPFATPRIDAARKSAAYLLGTHP